MNGRRRAVFLDRDGVLNAVGLRRGTATPPRSVDDLVILPGVEEACQLLRAAGFLLVCVTNQPDVARGTKQIGEVEAINRHLRDVLALDDVSTCPHDDIDACTCRKPKPGMLEDAARRWSVDLERSVMVGDRWVDIEAGRRAGCTTVLIGDGHADQETIRADLTAGCLAEAVPRIISGITRMSEPVLDLKGLRVQIFADGANRDGIRELAGNPLIKGFTTNPTLMRAAGISDYEAFARDVLEIVPSMPISFEVFADDFDEMERQGLRIASWGDNVFVKVPVTDSGGRSSAQVVSRLAEQGVQLNVTALMTPAQVRTVTTVLGGGPASFISVFAGRIADTGRDPTPIMAECLAVMAPHENLRLIWASPREVLNVLQAHEIGCHVITVTHDLLGKLGNIGKDLTEYSLDTVKMFQRDAVAAGYSL
jgi:transaldolase